MRDFMGSRCSACAGNGASASSQPPFTLKGLWDSLPLSLFLQICGTSAAKDVISKLNPDNDKPMGESWPFSPSLSTVSALRRPATIPCVHSSPWDSRSRGGPLRALA